MQLNIEDDRAHRLASELARMTGESMSSAVTRAIEERLERERSKVKAGRKGLAQKLLALGEDCSRLPKVDDRPGDAILYDEHGLPQVREGG